MSKVFKNAAKITAICTVGLLVVLVGTASAATVGRAACGAAVAGNSQSCAGGIAGTDCESWATTGGRIFRDGVNQGSLCQPKGCPGGGFSAGNTENYVAHYFDTNETECECMVVSYDNAACGASIHGSLFSGIYDPNQPWLCTAPLTASYLGDQGSSISGQNFSGATTDENITVLSHTNFGSFNCNFNFSIACVLSESLACTLGPIEAKLDELLNP
jgi:hypothetical protein